MGKFDEDGYKFSWENGKLKIIKGALIVARGELLGGLSWLIGDTMVDDAIVANVVTEAIMTWPRRLGHISKQGQNILLDRNLPSGLKSIDLEFCEDCRFGKHHRAFFSTVIIKSKNVLDLIHFVTWESPVESIGGSNYFISFVDDFFGNIWVYMLKRKSDAFSRFKNFKALVDNQTERKIKCLRTDVRMEFSDSIPFNGMPQQNGVVERLNRIVLGVC